MPAPKQPQDRKPKAVKTVRSVDEIAGEAGAVPYTFTHEGQTYELPAPDSDAMQHVTGQIIRDALMQPDDDGAQARLGMATLEASISDPELLTVLYSKPWGELADILLEWMSHNGTDAGKSPASSD